MIDGLSGDELKILDPMNEHRSDYVYLRFQALYPDIYRTVKSISRSGLTDVFLVLCGYEDDRDQTRMFMFDYDSGDIVGIVGTQKMYSTMFDIILNLPQFFYFVDCNGNPKFLTKSETEKEMTKNKIGQMIIQISETICDSLAKELEETILYGEKTDRAISEREPGSSIFDINNKP